MNIKEVEVVAKKQLKGKFVQSYLGKHTLEQYKTARDVYFAIEAEYKKFQSAHLPVTNIFNSQNKYERWLALAFPNGYSIAVDEVPPTDEQIQTALDARKINNPNINYLGMRDLADWHKAKKEWDEYKQYFDDAVIFKKYQQIERNYDYWRSYCNEYKNIPTEEQVQTALEKHAVAHEEDVFDNLHNKLITKLAKFDRDDIKIDKIVMADFAEIILGWESNISTGKSLTVKCNLFVRWNTRDYHTYFAQYPMRWKLDGKASTEKKVNEVFGVK